MNSDPSEYNLDEIESSPEGGYFVSLSDLMIGMLFVFMIVIMTLIIFYQSAAKRSIEAEADLRQKIEELAETRKDFENRINTLKKAETLFDENWKIRVELLKRIEDDLKRNNIRSEIDDDNGILRLSSDLLFATGEAVLRDDGRKALNVLADIFNHVLPCYTKNKELNSESCSKGMYRVLEAVFIEGHTDNIPVRTTHSGFKNNWELSALRAVRTYEALIEAQPILAQLENDTGVPLFGVSGYGELRPIAQNTSDAERSLNRRTDFRFVLATPSIETLRNLRQQALPPVPLEDIITTHD